MKHSTLLTFILVLFILPFGNSQNSNEPSKITSTFVIQNVHIISQAGQAPIFGSILIKDGLIESKGTSVNIPFDAEIIDGDSMYVYPGFIDALSHTGIKKEEEGERVKAKNPGNPPNDLAGITPDKSAMDLVSHKEKSIKDLRSSGFTISHTVPYGKMLPGNGSIILLDGESKEEMSLRENVSMYAQIKGARGVYPGTIIGVMAKWRELYRSAEFAKKHKSQYQSNPVGLKKPSYDKELEAFFPILEKKQKVFFEASNALTIQRALSLQKDLGFELVLADVKQGQNALDKIKSSGAQILLSFELPKEEKKEKEKDGDEKEKDGDEKEKKSEKKKDKIDPEKEALEKRKAESIKNYVAQAAFFEENNIPFSFSLVSGKANDLHANLRRMIEAGLSEKTALQALTSNPAKLLQIDKVAGTIDKGKLANLIMTDKPFFEEKAKIKYVFVQGNPFKTEEKKKKKKSEGDKDQIDIKGKWSYEMNIPMPNNTGVILIEKTGETFQVSISSADDPTDFEVIEDIELDGDNLVFDFDVDNGGMQMNIGMDLNFDEESFEGTVTAGQFGTFDMNGTRTSKDPKNN